jgi:hypothetical protein
MGPEGNPQIRFNHRNIALGRHASAKNGNHGDMVPEQLFC